MKTPKIFIFNIWNPLNDVQVCFNLILKNGKDFPDIYTFSFAFIFFRVIINFKILCLTIKSIKL